MPAHRANDPLVPVALRLPQSQVVSAKAEADATGHTLSDIIRSRIASAAVQPLGKPRPRKRPPPSIEAVSQRDPELVRQVAVIGNNLNQIARAANTAVVTGTPIEVIKLLVELAAIERKLGSLVCQSDEAGH